MSTSTLTTYRSLGGGAKRKLESRLVDGADGVDAANAALKLHADIIGTSDSAVMVDENGKQFWIKGN